MATQVDTRKLKDQASELLGKHKYDKAAEIFEQLSRVEPRDMQHRLKLGDTYRRLNLAEKAITAYQIAGRQFGEEGQLIKAIGAFKVILEIDPKNEAAQKDLAQMNQRRFAKPTMETAGLKAPKGIGAGARGTSDLELAEGEKVAAGIGAIFESGGRTAIEMTDDGEESPLELDMPGATHATRARPTLPAQRPLAIGKLGHPPAPPPTLTPAPIKPPERRGPPPRVRSSIELGGGTELQGQETVLDPDELEPEDLEPMEELEALDVDMPAPKPAPASPGQSPSTSWRSVPGGGGKLVPAPIAFPPKPAPGAPASFNSSTGLPSRKTAPEPQAIEFDNSDDEINLDVSVPPPARPAPGASPWRASPAETARTKSGAPAQYTTPKSSAGWKPVAPRPIADLLTAPEEIELLSLHTSDPGKPKPASPGALKSPPPPPRDLPGPPDPMPAVSSKFPPKVPLFDDLPHEAFLELVNRLSFKRRAPGELIIKEGELGRSFFVIVQGRVRVFKTRADGVEVGLARLGEGAFFGEMALLSGAPRTANVVAEEETELLEISDQMLREIVQHYPSVAQSLKNFYRQRLVNNVMATSPMFNEFDPMERRAVVERFRMRQVATNEVLIREGQRSDGLYVVLHGGVRVAKKTDSGEVELARLKEGELFGEMSLLSAEPASATVSAFVPTILLKLPADQFQELILTHPQILELVSDLTDKRRDATEHVLHDHGAPSHEGMSFV
jgi:CRP-like cAMP-binding protein